MEIYKINHICVNQLNTQFCLSYNKGIKIFNLKDLNQISCSNSTSNELGDVAISAMFYELSLVVFSGTQNNQKYHTKKIVLWDNEKKCVICSTQFKSEIINIKVIKKLTFVITKDEINICNINEKYSVYEIISKVSLDNISNPCFEVWNSNKENDKKYYLSHVTNKSDIEVTVIYENCLDSSKIKTFQSGFGEVGVQNVIYLEKLDLLFIIDGNGSYIKGFSTTKFEPLCEFYRGSNFSLISSITNIFNKFIAVASSNKTIHLFELNPSENSNSSFSSFIYKFITNPYQLNKSFLKIRLNEINQNEFEFFDSDFKKKGTILFFNQINNELTCLGYNGKIYVIKLDLENKSHLIKNTFSWCFADDIKNSYYTSDDVGFDLMGWKKNAEEESVDNWKII